MVSAVQSIGNDGAKVLVLDDGVLAKHLRLVHLDHALNRYTSTPVTFSQDAAPLMLFSTGEDYANDTPFFTSMMNFMQFMYMYSSAYFSINATYVTFNILC
jgi:hypothetical protein